MVAELGLFEDDFERFLGFVSRLFDFGIVFFDAEDFDEEFGAPLVHAEEEDAVVEAGLVVRC